MILSAKQIEAVKAGQPVAVDIPETGTVYVLNEETFQKILLLLQSEPDQVAFRQFAMREAERIASKTRIDDLFSW